MDTSKYPNDWASISRQIRDQAGNCCEFCEAPNGEVIQRNADGEWMVEDDLERMNSTDAWRWLGTWNPPPPVRIVLTVAHLDHDTSNNDPCNLRALCQRCHLNWDRERHIAKQRANRLARSGQVIMDLGVA